MATAPNSAAVRAAAPSDGAQREHARVDDAVLRELVAAIADGDQRAMAELYDSTQRLVFTLARRILGAGDLAEEVTLDTYMQVWRSAPSFDYARGRVSTWLLTIARSRALDRRRSVAARTSREETWSDALADETPDCTCGVDPAHEQSRAERRDTVRAAMGALPELQRRAIELAYFPGLSHTEIAARLGEPLGTVKTRIRLGMIKLRDLLQTLEDRP
jgi:RNA polymerase sigma-70 factor (ECF subfamily)